MDVSSILRCGICGEDFTKPHSIKFIPSNHTGHYFIDRDGSYGPKFDSTFNNIIFDGRASCLRCDKSTFNCIAYHIFRLPLDEIPLIINDIKHDSLFFLLKSRLEYNIESIYSLEKGYPLPDTMIHIINGWMDQISSDGSFNEILSFVIWKK